MEVTEALDSSVRHLHELPMPPRPLHYQIVLQREITICKKMDMHLTWGNGRIFLKPIPRFLLSPAIWETHLECAQDCECGQEQSKGVRGSSTRKKLT